MFNKKEKKTKQHIAEGRNPISIDHCPTKCTPLTVKPSFQSQLNGPIIQETRVAYGLAVFKFNQCSYHIGGIVLKPKIPKVPKKRG